MAVLSEGAFLVTLLMSSVHPFFHRKDEVRLGFTGGEATFPILPDLHATPGRYEAYLYRQTPNRSILLQNSSSPSRSTDMEQSDRVSCFFTSRDAPHAFVLRNLSLADSGEYMTEVWANGTYRDWTQYDLTVCADRLTAEREEFADAIEWMLSDLNTSEEDTVQLYTQNLLKPACPSDKGRNTLILDTNRSLTSLKSDLDVEVRSLSNGTWIRVSNVPRASSRICSHIVARRGDECRLYSERMCTFLFGRTPSYVHFLKAGDQLALPCHPRLSPAPDPVQWATLRGSRSRQIGAVPANASSEESRADMADFAVRNDSLVVPAALPTHSGMYCCTTEARPQTRTPHWLFVCSQLGAARLMLVWGDSVQLQCLSEDESNSQAESFSVVQWYRQRGPEPEDLIVEVDYLATGRVQEDLGGRVSFSHSCLTISGLRTDDSGEYICRLWQGLNGRNASCFERRVRLVKRDFYTVYASVLGTGLLGMICAVVFVSVRFR